MIVESSNYTSASQVEGIVRQLGRELPGQDIDVTIENETVFLRGRVKDRVSSERAVAIASTFGRTVNLLYVDVPLAEPQILLKVRFVSVDRSAGLDLGFNLASTGAGNTIGSISKQQFSAPQITTSSNGTTAALSDAFNIFLLRPDLNLLATIKALEAKSLLDILAEPNVLSVNGKQASFLAGGEFPYPVFQGAANGLGTVTVQFREFGVRLVFTPVITPRGTIRLQVSPEVSALDFTGGLTVQGFNVPALTVRKVDTEVELAAGQSFAIAGLIDNRLTETINKIPALGDIPMLGKLFQSKSRSRQNTELLIIVTPELVNPIGSDQPEPEMKYPQPLLWPKTVSGDDGAQVTQAPFTGSIPVETLGKSSDKRPIPEPRQFHAPRHRKAAQSSRLEASLLDLELIAFVCTGLLDHP